jgi:hypothetical protein
VNEETFGEILLKTTTLVVIALVISLMLMAAADLHFRFPEPAGKRSEPGVVHTPDPPKDRPKNDQS